MHYRTWIVPLSSLALAACFDPAPSANDGSAESSGGGSTSTGVVPPDDTTAGTGQASGDGTTTAEPGTTGSSTTGAVDSTGGDSSSSGGPVCPDVGPAGLPGVNPQAIWIANSNQSTISKIDTVTLTELGRYVTRPDAAGNPSRTSVSLNGNVAVANRSGGLTKFYGDLADCTDRDGDGMITTSSGGTDVVPWDDEECRAWFLPLVYTSQRPVAWTTGTTDVEACTQVGEQVWTSGVIDGTTIEVLRVDGETGAILDSVTIPEVAPSFYGIYGGAVDSQGNFWGSQLGQGSLIRVDSATFTYDTWPMPTSGYGMTVGASGYVFTCANNVGRFDPTTETWDVVNAVGGAGGCMEDLSGRLWLANDPLVALDVNSLMVTQTIDLPNYVHGVSVDFAGYVWGAAIFSDEAYRVDPMSGAVDVVSGLEYPYTYSDMTGYALAAVAP